jgi:hypothetical protein
VQPSSINEELLMLKQTKAIQQSIVDGKSMRRFEGPSGELRAAEPGNVVPFRPRLHFQAGQLRIQAGQLRTVSLAKVKAENAALRNLAVELALEIRDLRDGRRWDKAQGLGP